MRLAALLLPVLALFMFAGPVEARKAPLADPAPVAVPAGLTAEQVTKDIKRALIGRGWVVSEERPGEILATLNLREHVAKVRVTWDTREIRIAYVDSTNLEYSERKGTRYIHPNYLGWVKNIATDMGTNLQLSAAE